MKDAIAAQREMYEQKFTEMQKEFEKLAQYSRHNCLIVHGRPIKMKKRENANEVCKTFFKTSLGIKINNHDIDESQTRRLNTTSSASTASRTNHIMLSPAVSLEQH